MHFCTTVRSVDVAWARTLVSALRARHRDLDVTVLVVGARGRVSVEGAEVVGPDELGLDPRELETMTLVHHEPELAAALQPALLRYLLLRGHDHAVFVGAHRVVLAALDGLDDLARSDGVVLVPRMTAPMERDGATPDEQDVLLTGAYDAGLLAVGSSSETLRMLDWWHERCLTQAHDDPGRGEHLAQRWLDLVPGLFEHHLLRDAALVVSALDPGSRVLELDAGGVLRVDAAPVRVVDLAGYDVRAPHLLSSRSGPRPRVLLSEQPAMRAVCDAQRERLLAAGALDRVPSSGPGDGPVVDDVVRELVRSEVTRPLRGIPARTDLAERSLEEWLDSPDPESPFAPLSRYLSAIYASRPDLRGAFPEAAQGDHARFLSWAERHGRRELSIPQERIDRARERAIETASSPLLGRVSGGPRTRTVPGVEVVGYLTAELGQGESARQFVAALETAGVPVSTSTYTRLSSRRGVSWTERLPEPGTRHATVLLCVSPEALPDLVEDLGPAALEGRHRIGLWFWELPDFPDRLRPSLDLVDEIWVASDFNATALRAATDKPVVVVPHPAHAPAASDVRPAEVPDDGRYTFLFVFDFFSVLERKNPMTTIAAFRRAFPEPGRARLVIKSINGDRAQDQRERLRYLVAGDEDIVLIERYLSRAELDGLMHAADCYVSLHRSEGFGQTLAESMAIGKPVVATAYSGNLEFTRPTNSVLVPATLTPVPPGCAPYLPPAEWGEPDLEQAVAALTWVVDHPGDAAALGARAAETIRTEFSIEALAAALRRRIDEIEARRATGPVPEPAPSAPRRRRWRV